ncbi:hypothetical protein NNJEOMEG_01718 [Fundidesulfovibrio magnetotacticus]|uniref:HDOD domain-containing protein n=1 Tax=Fundidesulfovibrio magnetotacticus TaxID=2730080 RepID=A0A6V8LSD4_9BACT|nr:HDOD domain-containing protein [Fundidesulfovibrio magnetotacticus]GFK93880.1 hypothetical protein NNJEOMEG_01718 [Fundidesulfovibrio magnetotacticus]
MAETANLLGRGLINAESQSAASPSERAECCVVFSSMPIFDHSKNIIGRELYGCNLGDEYSKNAPGIFNKNIVDEIKSIAERHGRLEFISVDIPLEHLTDDVLDMLPLNLLVLPIHSKTKPDDTFSAKVKFLKEKGVRFALKGCQHDTNIGAFGPLCNFISVNMSEAHGLNLNIVKLLKKHGFKVIAGSLNDWHTFSAALDAGFDCFHGQFFAKHDATKAIKAKSLPQVKLKLMKMFSGTTDSVDIEELSKTISLDAALSVKLLKLVNSSAFSLRYPVDSVRQAVQLVGLDQLKKWVTVALLSEQDGSDKGLEVMFLALHRALFLNLLADTGALNCDGELAFMLGLLSCADAIFGVEMSIIVDDLKLSDSLKSALNREEGGEFTWIINMLEYVDQNMVDESVAMMARYDIDRLLAAKLYMNSSRIAKSLLRDV